MRKGIISFLLIITVSFGFLEKPKAALISPDHPALKICGILSNPASALFVWPTIWPSIQAIPFPPFIAPGILMGLSQETSMITLVCKVLTEVSQFDIQNGVNGVRGITNALTGDRWDSHLDQADRTFNIANTVYDFESGTYRKGVLESESAHKQMREFVRDSYSWYNATVNKKDVQIQTRNQSEADMEKFSRLVYRRTILTEATNCPDPSGNPDYTKIYKNEIAPLYKQVEETEPNMDFFKTKLVEMGVRFANNQEDYAKYVQKVEGLLIQGVNYQITYKQKTEVKKVPHKERKNRDGTPVMIDKTMSTQTQIWSAKIFADVFTDFKRDYSQRWSNYVTNAFMATGTQGLLTDDPTARIENEFRDLNYECNPNRLMSGIPIDRPDYEKLYDERVGKCKEETRINQKKADNLFNYYVSQLQAATFSYKKAQGEIWTKESWYLGTNRSVNTRDKTDGYQQQEVACAEGNALTSAEMDELKLKQQGVTTELKEIIAKEKTKQVNNMTQKKKAEAEIMKKKQAAQKLSKERDSAQKDAMKNSSTGGMTIDGVINDGNVQVQ